jgi:hypothetical protein
MKFKVNDIIVSKERLFGQLGEKKLVVTNIDFEEGYFTYMSETGTVDVGFENEDDYYLIRRPVSAFEKFYEHEV